MTNKPTALTDRATNDRVRSLQSPAPLDIAALAYELWEKRGRSEGSPVDDWVEAERQLREREPTAA